MQGLQEGGDDSVKEEEWVAMILCFIKALNIIDGDENLSQGQFDVTPIWNKSCGMLIFFLEFAVFF